jgi:CxxC motif-containing protein
MTTKEMICIICPVGCRMTVTAGEDGSVVSVSGNSCARGKTYAESEFANPVRTLTTTVKINSRREALLAVKSSKPIPRDKQIAAVRSLRVFTASVPVRMGDVLICDFIEPGTNLVACKDVLK